MPTTEVWTLEVSTGTWQEFASLPKGIYDCGATITSDNRLCVLGGKDVNGSLFDQILVTSRISNMTFSVCL